MKCLTYAGVGGKGPRTGKFAALPTVSPKAEERVLCRLAGLCSPLECGVELVRDKGWLAARRTRFLAALGSLPCERAKFIAWVVSLNSRAGTTLGTPFLPGVQRSPTVTHGA
jgi:hypothetical protein